MNVKMKKDELAQACANFNKAFNRAHTFNSRYKLAILNRPEKSKLSLQDRLLLKGYVL
jgi:hypothetical protein